MKDMSVKLYISPNTDAAFNMALEEYIFENLKEGERFYLFYRNGPSVIIGKNQNTADEVDESACRRDHVKIVRRMTGGGAVYHDLGNFNFSIMKPGRSGGASFEKDLEPVILALRTMDLPCERSERNDILLAGKKISGCAMRESGGRTLVHGTLLYDSAMNRIGRYLTVSEEKMKGKGVKSVRARVGLVRDYLMERGLPAPSREEFFRTFLEALLKESGAERFSPDRVELKKIEELKERKYETGSWNFGRSPKYNIRREKKFPSGLVSVYLNVREGLIEEIRIFSDGFGNAPMEELERTLEGAAFRKEAVLFRLPENLEDYIRGMDREALAELITEER